MTSEHSAASAQGLRSRERNFLIFWISQGFDALGDAFAKIAIPLLVLDVTGSVTQMGLVTALIGVGSLVASISSGLFIDRIDRRTLMMACDVARVLLYLLIPVGWQITGPSIGIVYVVTAVCAYLSTIFFITHTAAIPHLVSDDQLMQANSKIQATVGLSYVLGPMLAGFFASRLGTGTAIGVLIVLYGMSLVLMLFVRMYERAHGPGSELGGRRSALDELLGGIRFILGHKVLFWVALLLGLFAFMSEATIDLVIFRLKELGQSEQTIGVIFGIASIGAIAAAITAPRLRRTWGFGRCFLGSLIVQGVSIGLVGMVEHAWSIGVLAFTFSLGLMMRNINSMSFRQEVTPSHLLGRVSAAFWSILLSLGPIGAVVATTLAELTSATGTLMVMGILGVAVAVIGFITPVRAQ